MSDDTPKSDPLPATPPSGPLAALGNEAGCAVYGVPIAAVIASVYIFDSAVKAGSAWAGAAATAALALMALGIIWVLARTRA